jgi:fluoride exporter
MSLVWLALLGGLGALARSEVGEWAECRPERWGLWATLVVNVSGSFGLGLAAGSPGTGLTGPDVLAAVSGFLGGFTTFSTWTVATVALGAEPRPGKAALAAANVAVMLAGGLLGVGLGIGLRNAIG